MQRNRSYWERRETHSAGCSCGLSPFTLTLVITHESLPFLDVLSHHVWEGGGQELYSQGKYILSPECVGAVSHKATLLSACHLNDKWSYCELQSWHLYETIRVEAETSHFRHCIVTAWSSSLGWIYMPLCYLFIFIQHAAGVCLYITMLSETLCS